MDERYEFDGTLEYDGRDTVTFLGIDGFKTFIDAAHGGRYHVTLTQVEPELKPCPFCGGEAEVRMPSGDYQVGCWNDCAVQPSTRWWCCMPDAIKAWNRRHSPGPKPQREVIY